MSITQTCASAARSLHAHKLRSILTTFGIVIGVAAVILLVGLGDGLREGYQTAYAPMASQITLSKVKGSVVGGQTHDLTDLDVKALEDRAQPSAVATVTPVVSGQAMATYEQAKYQADVTGSTSDYLTITDQELAQGEMFGDRPSNQRVVVLGPDIATALFGTSTHSAVGEQVRLGRENFTVIGVLASSGQNKDNVVVPLKAARSLFGGADRLDQIIVKAVGPNRVKAAVDEITPVLDERHLIKDPSKRDYRVKNMQDRVDKMNDTLSFLSIFIIAIGAISLIVGGLGVANIMLVSVTERTREIGIRKAIGARSAAIMKQFLTEATVLAGLGGLVGIGVGVGLTLAAARLMPHIAPKYGTPTVNSAAVAIAFMVSLVIGLVAGGYPAWRAARLRPVEALRFQ
ncbi:ABC transporter permease [Pseudonocardia eucalypti]|uniref:ABC transporter permease n=2 Tax=Pseudonocardia eucalypti TaxID=648755 RepID=A0ABP9RF47_9PSEU